MSDEELEELEVIVGDWMPEEGTLLFLNLMADYHSVKEQRDFYEERCGEQSKELAESANRLKLVREQRDDEIVKNYSNEHAGGWIHINDEYPEFEQNVLLFTIFDEEILVGYRSSMMNGFLLAGCNSTIYIYPTHWRPLPTPPTN